MLTPLIFCSIFTHPWLAGQRGSFIFILVSTLPAFGFDWACSIASFSLRFAGVVRPVDWDGSPPPLGALLVVQANMPATVPAMPPIAVPPAAPLIAPAVPPVAPPAKKPTAVPSTGTTEPAVPPAVAPA